LQNDNLVIFLTVAVVCRWFSFGLFKLWSQTVSRRFGHLRGKFERLV
jgi:hypothetical protein